MGETRKTLRSSAMLLSWLGMLCVGLQSARQASAQRGQPVPLVGRSSMTCRRR